MNFTLVAEQNNIVVGKLSDEKWSGAYLSSEFMDRLASVHNAAQTRLADMNEMQIPDAVRNLLGIMTRLLSTYAAAIEPEQQAHYLAHQQEAWKLLLQAKSIADDLDKH